LSVPHLSDIERKFIEFKQLVHGTNDFAKINFVGTLKIMSKIQISKQF